MTVDIVTHVYGPFYITLLAEQAKSLVGRRHLKLNIFYDLDESHLFPELFSDIRFTHWRWHPLHKPQLLNRTIGRNRAAKATTADWIWFADADYLFGPGSLEAVAKLDPHAACMYWPRFVLRPEKDDWYDDWPTGIDPVERCTRPENQRKAIGGCQIVPGHIARTWGYLDGVERHQRPATGNEFLDTRGDKAIRGWLQSKTGLPILPADIPNVMRLRHRIPETSQRHLMTEPEFRLHGKTPIPADAALSSD